MAEQPSTVQLQEFRSWFDDTEYTNRASLLDMMNDPIFTLLGEDDSDNRSDTLSTNGIDYSGYAPAKTPGGTINKDAPVEEDQHSVKFVSFWQRFDYEYETILHDKYRMNDPEGNELIVRLWNAVGLFLTNCFWNQNTSTSFNVTSHDGTITYTNSTPDGAAIVSAAHSGPGYSGKTNIGGTTPLSVPNLTTNHVVGQRNIQMPSGHPIAYNPDLILIGNQGEMKEGALQITKSVKVPGSANNAVNIYSGGTYDVVEFKHAPKTAAGARDTAAASEYKWASADRKNVSRMFKYKWAARPHIFGQSTELDMDNGSFFRIAMCRIAFMPESPWALVQNNATAAPVHPG